jgi:Fe2+ or Zn2+ uptake regulation protein
MSLESYIKRLRQRGHRVTPKVRAVLRLFLQRRSVLDPFEVRMSLQRQFKGVGLPTVYRILESLANCGILLTAANPERQLRYYLCQDIEEEHHHHFICLECGKVEEVNLCLMEEVEQYVERRLKATVQNHLLQIEGLCAKCTLDSRVARDSKASRRRHG